MARPGRVVAPFTVPADAALPVDVRPREVIRSGEHQGMRGRNVARAAGTSTFSATTRRSARPPVSLSSSGASVKYLDGFALLEASCSELPEEATKASIESADLCGLVLQDLAFFRRLVILNLGDNKLGAGGVCDVLSRLGSALPSLVDLRLHCNGISAIEPLGRVPFFGAPEGFDDSPLFPNLEILDLSYNALNAESIRFLSVLPKLRELDLTCNGLTRLPDWVRTPAC